MENPPHLVGVRYQGDAIIALAKNREVHYPIAFLPLTLRQLDRLLRALSTNARLRADLARPKALTTVLTILEPPPPTNSPTAPGAGGGASPGGASPARAGMIPHRAPGQRLRRGEPRASGDDPDVAVIRRGPGK